MDEQDQLVVFTICGQEFRLRADAANAERIKTVAASVEGMIRERKGRSSELRAAIMAAYELAFELQHAREEIERLKAVKAAQKMDNLLERIEKEMRSSKQEPGSDKGTKNKG